MKITMTFDLPDEAEEHRMALNGSKYLYALQEVDQKLRGILKYQDYTKEVGELCDDLRGMIRALIQDDLL